MAAYERKSAVHLGRALARRVLAVRVFVVRAIVAVSVKVK
jgi:hypothetical protein